MCRRVLRAFARGVLLGWGMGPSDVDIQRAAELLVRRFRPQKVILFGSRAYGTPREDSDADLLVVLPFEGSTYAMMASMFDALYPLHGFDLIARTPEDAAKRYAWGDPLMREALDRGKVLYEAAA